MKNGPTLFHFTFHRVLDLPEALTADRERFYPRHFCDKLGYEPTAVNDTVKHPLKALKTVLTGIRTSGPMAPEISLENQRPAEFVFDKIVKEVTEASPPPARKSARSDHAA